MSDYCDGTAFQSHRLFVMCPQALQIMVYYDDLEICNPLGSRAKTHKLGMSPLRDTVRCVRSACTALEAKVRYTDISSSIAKCPKTVK